MKLYYWPGTRAARARWLLEELDVACELVRLDPSRWSDPAYLRMHPHGQVPLLIDGEVIVHETCGICLYLADKFITEGLAPPYGSPVRGEYFKWMAYSLIPTDPPLWAIETHRSGSGPGMWDLPTALGRAQNWAGALERALEGRRFFLGDTFTAVDVTLGSGIVWAKSLEVLAPRSPLHAYIDRITSRPAYVRAHAD
jgi:glutathione S-transferase